MAATIITVAKIDDSDTNVQIKVNDGHPVPTQIVTDTIQSFKTWKREEEHIFVWINNAGQERAMIVSCQYIGWVVSTTLITSEENCFSRYNKFSIDAPCTVTIEEELI